ncbi:hypothetical protein BAG01nite_40340 [Brevibacillus agri]|uniref:Uncharacterized protein n=1 Tax=Brevibacillus agri TaxID=51101 RepID=A0A3M8AKB9_9BACL|nr:MULTISPECIES: hypothetical protein [Brevibacillus]ELK43212.1 hypothetical protein D478_04590 [Brevibacillus agri BAB-2500]EJL42820.1 hypothetical protein PMI08_03043 [Brevibacillus sp. CF112]MBG9564659.1 hypothetical protein [Brevibacillus agri]MBY0052712.1 hypothetical protein [Brevibacillus agri]MCG5253869.1 hypothetical protein [Brevibacillus agri]
MSEFLVIAIPLLLGIVGFVCLLLGLFGYHPKRIRINLTISGICFFLLFAYLIIGYFYTNQAASAFLL